MSNFLIFQLYGAMASWGDIAVGEYRPSRRHPSKSAIIGMIGAALGVDRENDALHKELTKRYCIAVSVRAFSELMRDYHTTQVPRGNRKYATRRYELAQDNLKTILSQRDYITDAYYLVAIWTLNHTAPYTLHDLQKALQEPKFNLYLGRKSCPLSMPLHPIISSNVNLKQAFERYPVSKAEAWTKKLNISEQASYFWEQGRLTEQETGLNSSMVYLRRDQLVSRRRWQFINREEHSER